MLSEVHVVLQAASGGYRVHEGPAGQSQCRSSHRQSRLSDSRRDQEAQRAGKMQKKPGILKY